MTIIDFATRKPIATAPQAAGNSQRVEAVETVLDFHDRSGPVARRKLGNFIRCIERCAMHESCATFAAMERSRLAGESYPQCFRVASECSRAKSHSTTSTLYHQENA